VCDEQRGGATGEVLVLFLDENNAVFIAFSNENTFVRVSPSPILKMY
jgi:hypothetical protein